MEESIKYEIKTWVQMAFYSKKELIEIFCEEMYEPDELNKHDVEQIIDDEIQKIKREQQTWPQRTDFDKLEDTFIALHNKGIIAIHNAGYTQSNGYDDIMEIYHNAETKEIIIGYCFYHGQDLERAVQGNGLCLSFGPIIPDEEQIEGPEIGKTIINELKKSGFTTKWNGTFDDRIIITTIDWKKRI